MAIKQRKAPAAKAAKPKRKIEEISSSEDEVMEQEYHIEPSEASDQDEPAEEEFHTDPEDASPSPEPQENSIPLLPTALLKSTPSAPSKLLDWDKMSQRERKALRDELGVSMKELRSEAQRNGVLDAGRMAQMKRGIRPAEKVAGGRVVKRKRRGGGAGKGKAKAEKSGRQRLVEERGREVKKRKG